jgi:TonB family protein
MPEYPAQTVDQGLGGLVIVELTIDERGRVKEARILRSVPGLDEAALAAVRQWEYEISRLDKRPVAVTLSVPISFPKRLPSVSRQAGIPELRQGALVAIPSAQSNLETITASVSVTLDNQGEVDAIETSSGEAPWIDALTQAVKTWRFAPASDAATLSFRIEAEFRLKAKEGPRVALRLTGLRSSVSSSDALPAPSSAPATTAADIQGSLPSTQVIDGPPSHVKQPRVSPSAVSEQKDIAPPETEVITAPPPAPPREHETEAGVSSLPSVSLSIGVPDLVRGRRPIVPPLARMAAQTGRFTVRFSVDSAGLPNVQAIPEADALLYASEQTVKTWVFKRTTLERLWLEAVFDYTATSASAVIRPATPTAAP